MFEGLQDEPSPTIHIDVDNEEVSVDALLKTDREIGLQPGKKEDDTEPSRS